MRTLILFTFFLSVIFIKAQNTELTSNTWYLQKLISSNGTTVLTPNNVEVNAVTANFGNGQMQTHVLSVFNAWLMQGNAITPTTITYDGFAYDPNFTGCQISSNCTFQNNYYFFLGYGFPMNYQIIQESNYLKLILTNTSGNQAIYYTQNLMVNDVEKNSDIEIFPIPAFDVLTIKTNQSKFKIELYDSLGRLVLNKNIDKNTPNYKLNIESIAIGSYYLTIKDRNEKIISTSKVIKK